MVLVAVDVELVVPELVELPVPVAFAGNVHHLVLKVVVVLPDVCVPVRVTGGVTLVGFELVAVFDELCVLAVPPLIVGSILIMGWMLIAGSTVTVCIGPELWLRPKRSWRPRPLGVPVKTGSW